MSEHDQVIGQLVLGEPGDVRTHPCLIAGAVSVVAYPHVGDLVFTHQTPSNALFRSMRVTSPAWLRGSKEFSRDYAWNRTVDTTGRHRLFGMPVERWLVVAPAPLRAVRT